MIPKEKIKVIAHGVPDLQYDQDASKKEFKLENKKVSKEKLYIPLKSRKPLKN